MIHTYGDSHSWFGWRDVKITKVNVNHLGPRLMYSFGANGEIVVDSKKLSTGDVVIFCFGEIDCRCHIHKFVNLEKNNINEVIENVVSLYIQTVDKNMNTYRNMNVATFIYSVPPPIRKAEGRENNEFPFLGTDEERKSYHQQMNEILRKKCSENNIGFFDVYKEYSDSEGYMVKNLSDGICHIYNPIYIEQKLKDYGIANG